MMKFERAANQIMIQSIPKSKTQNIAVSAYFKELVGKASPGLYLNVPVAIMNTEPIAHQQKTGR
jgi:hypothetical protein